MARKRRKPQSRSGGSTVFGIMIGLILGLIAAVAVALFVTKVPMPFVDKASRDPAQTLLPDVRNAPDPNIGLYGKSALPDAVPMMPPPTRGSAPVQPEAPPARSGDNLGDLIASLATGNAPTTPPPARPSQPAAPPAGAGKPAQGNTSSVIPGVTEPSTVEPDPAPDATQTRYFLQAGAFRSADDAEAITARILLMGLPAQVQKAQVGGSTINRVRVGPFTGIDEMNRARAQLGSEKIESSVVRQ